MKKIDISTKKYPNTFALVDDEDYKKLIKKKWCVKKGRTVSYAVNSTRVKGLGEVFTVGMHRIVMDLPIGEPQEIDHIDGNGLNNQKANLRVCTRSENMRNTGVHVDNTSGYKGVTWHGQNKKWQVFIRDDGKPRYLGTFTCLIKAAKAYDAGARKYHGEFARCNFPQ